MVPIVAQIISLAIVGEVILVEDIVVAILEAADLLVIAEVVVAMVVAVVVEINFN